MQQAIDKNETMSNIPHTHALFTRVMDVDMQERNISLLYTLKDNWFGYNGYSYVEELHKHIIHIMHEDKTVLGYQTTHMKLANGLYVPNMWFEAERIR